MRDNHVEQKSDSKKERYNGYIRAFFRYLTILFLVGTFILQVPMLVEPVKKALSSEFLTMSFGKYQLTAFSVIQDLIIMVTLFWLANRAQKFLEYRLKKSRRLKSSERNLIAKVSQIVILILTFFIAMDLIGVDMNSINILGGTIGIGLGFGLQKIASNFISGLILTFEKSLNEGDVIELPDGTVGVVEEAGARYTQITTYDGRDIMVPNEDFITNPVINWTYNNNRARGQINIAVAYDSDIKQARDIILRAAQEHPGLSKIKEPVVNLENFGENAVNFSLQIWVDDVRDGLKGPSSDIQFRIWQDFHDAGIAMPIPPYVPPRSEVAT